jgi:DNA-binding NarL/FixJ family response regulator
MPGDRAAGLALILADDHPLVLDGLDQLFRLEPDIQVTARCSDGDEVLRTVRAQPPDVLVLDLLMPGRDGFEVLESFEEEQLEVRTVVLTASLDDDQLLRAVRLGARGIVLKDMAPRLLVEAVRIVHGGGYWLEKGLGSRALLRLLEKGAEPGRSARRLTPRELEIVRLVSRGLRNRAVGEMLHITEGTVKIHLHNIYEKLGIGSRLELARFAQRKGLDT